MVGHILSEVFQMTLMSYDYVTVGKWNNIV